MTDQTDDTEVSALQAELADAVFGQLKKPSEFRVRISDIVNEPIRFADVVVRIGGKISDG